MSAQQPLHSLLPTTRPLPPRLVQLSSSLLAQSRNRAANLKPEEEIARSHACAEIACKRLRSQLRLPPTTGRPPCKPAVYKKLLGFLEGALNAGVHKPEETSSTTSRNTPKKRTADGEVKNGSAVNTPTLASRKKNAFAGTIDGEPQNTNSDAEAPDLIMPLVRKLCRTFRTPLLPPHVYTGACVVLKLSGLWPRKKKGSAKEDEKFNETLAVVTLALYFMVLTRMQKGKVTTAVFTARCEKAIDAAGLGTPSQARAEVEAWIKKMNAEGWCRDQDWWDSVPEDVMEKDALVGEDQDGGGVADDDELVPIRSRKPVNLQLNDEDEDDPEGVLLPGLGTMMQEAVDWLSENRRLHHLEWRRRMMDRIKGLEKGKGRAVASH